MPPAIRTTLEEIALRRDYTLEQFLQSKKRSAALVQARREAYTVLRLRGWAYKRIGELFDVDHATVIKALARKQKAPPVRAGL
jgi:chromosomal replication initiation ATPase DnaA